MDELTYLQNIDFFEWFIIFVAIVVAGKFLYTTFIEDIIQKHGWESKKMRQRREDHELLIKTSQNLAALQEKHEKDENHLEECLSNFIEETRKENNELRSDMRQFTENRVHDRGQSLEIQKELTDAQLAISNSVHEISEKIDAMQKSTDERFLASEEKQNKRVQSEIKERIAQSYRRYNLSKKITSIELEALEDLITTYENHGGINSFVHSVVQKEMYTWEVIE